MKTTEQKAKAYDEAIERARQIHSEGKAQCADVMTKVFPELKESEDERIKEEITELVMQPTWKTEKEFHRRLELCAWLKKQKVTDEEIIFRPVVGTDIRIAAKQALEKIDIGKKVVLAFNGAYISVNGKTVGEIDSEYDAWLERQGEQESVIIIPKFRIGDEIRTTNEEPLTITKIDDKGYWSKDLFICGFDDAAKWELVEQNPADKVEPNFKVGDWILIDNPCQIESIDNNGNYIVRYCDAEEKHLLSRNFCDSHFHLWTIQDAKDGDVLVDEDVDIIGIFEGIEGMCWHSKIYYSNTTKELYGTQCGGSHLKEFAKPATKEQRDLLFQKMKEAGYEWDAEKKELKLLITNGGNFFKSENCEQNPTWSDEKTLNTTISFLSEYAAKGYENAVMCIDWLKSLKDRYTWKPSDEQLNNILDILLFDNCTPKRRELLESLYEQLKKL